MEDEDFWNKSNIQSFSFDDDEKVRCCLKNIFIHRFILNANLNFSTEWICHQT